MVALRALVLALQNEVAVLRQTNLFYYKDGDLVDRAEKHTGFFSFWMRNDRAGHYECSVRDYVQKKGWLYNFSIKKRCDNETLDVICVATTRLRLSAPAHELWRPTDGQRTAEEWEMYVGDSIVKCDANEMQQRLHQIEVAVEQWMKHSGDDFSQFRAEFDKFLRAVRACAQNTPD